MNSQLLSKTFTNIQIRNISTHFRLYQNHYDSLGITKHATQADIKTAYYKLSMVYHPDKNSDSDVAAKKFRDITEAYKVLSNVKTRKLYDKGLYIQTPINFSGDSGFNTRQTASQKKWSGFTPSGRTTVYDFDEWSRAHYEATFARDMRNKRRMRQQRETKEMLANDLKSEKMILLLGTLFFFCAYVFYGRDSDKIKIKNIGENVVIDRRD